MGFYIEVPMKTGKALQLVRLWGAKVLSQKPASFNDVPSGKALVCIINNGPWEAAGFCYSRDELERFDVPDGRPRTWLFMDLNLVIKLTGYKKEDE